MTQKVKIYSERLTDKRYKITFTTVAQIQFIILVILAHSIVNQIIGQFDFKRIKILDSSNFLARYSTTDWL